MSYPAESTYFYTIEQSFDFYLLSITIQRYIFMPYLPRKQILFIAVIISCKLSIALFLRTIERVFILCDFSATIQRQEYDEVSSPLFYRIIIGRIKNLHISLNRYNRLDIN